MEIKLLMRIAKHDGAINFISKTFLACYKFIWLQTSLALQEFLNTPRSFLIGRNESDRNNSIFALKIYFFADFQPYSDGIRILTVEIQHKCTILVVFYSRTFCSCWLLEVKIFLFIASRVGHGGVIQRKGWISYTVLLCFANFSATT